MFCAATNKARIPILRLSSGNRKLLYKNMIRVVLRCLIDVGHWPCRPFDVIQVYDMLEWIV